MRDFASHDVVEGVKAQRTRKLQGLRMSWKLHEVNEQTILCTREQEVFKADEFIGQIAVRFVTMQASLFCMPFSRVGVLTDLRSTLPPCRVSRFGMYATTWSAPVRTKTRKR